MRDVIALESLVDPAPLPPCRHWLCTKCFLVSVSRDCTACGSDELIPHLDRRPLRLGRETSRRILDLMDEAVELVGTLPAGDARACKEIDFILFLTQVLMDADIVDHRPVESCAAFRTTTLSDDEIVAVLRARQLPPSAR